jgi:hypothetical protein
MDSYDRIPDRDRYKCNLGPKPKDDEVTWKDGAVLAFLMAVLYLTIQVFGG